MIHVLIVHQTALIGSIISSVLSGEPDIEVLDQANSVDEALSKLEEKEYNVILVTATLPDNGAMRLTEAVAEVAPEVKVLVTGLPEAQSAILQFVTAGASGYVLQDVPVENLLDNVRAVHDGKAIVSPDIAAALMTQVSKLARISAQSELDPAAYDELTPREHDVLNLIGQGLTNQEIADRLFIEVGTVKNHVHNILKKLDASSRDEAAAHLPFIQEEEQSNSLDSV
jgi:DNA-binding NarL/FixJ family response regulator